MNLPFEIDPQQQEVYQRILLTLLALVATYMLVRTVQRTTLKFIAGTEPRS